MKYFKYMDDIKIFAKNKKKKIQKQKCKLLEITAEIVMEFVIKKFTMFIIKKKKKKGEKNRNCKVVL